jgi:hypothetical protein
MIGHIYCIKSKQTTNIYIGSTKLTLEERLQYHKNNYNAWLNKKYGYTTSFEILKYDDYYIELIETIEYNKDDELFAREGYYQRIMECVNKYIMSRTHKQWIIDNQEHMNQYLKQYNLNNKPHKQEYNKQYYLENQEQLKEQRNKYYSENKEQINKKKGEKYTCECGLICNKSHKSRHEKTQKHITFLEQNKI